MVNSVGVDWCVQKASIIIPVKTVDYIIAFLDRFKFEPFIDYRIFIGNEYRPVFLIIKILSVVLEIYV